MKHEENGEAGDACSNTFGTIVNPQSHVQNHHQESLYEDHVGLSEQSQGQEDLDTEVGMEIDSMEMDSGFTKRVESKDNQEKMELDLDTKADNHPKVKEKCCFCAYIGSKADLCEHIANDCEILSYEKEKDIDVAGGISDDSGFGERHHV